MNKIEYFKKILKESVEEKILPHSGRKELNDDIGNLVKKFGAVVFHMTYASPEAFVNGGNRSFKEYMSTMAYGRGVYTTMSINRVAAGGSYKLVFAVKPKVYDNFIIYENYFTLGNTTLNVRQELAKNGMLSSKYVNETLQENVERVILRKKPELRNAFYSFIGGRKISQTGVYRFFTQNDGEIFISDSIGFYTEEKIFDECGVEGYIYNNGIALFRNCDVLLPICYYDDQMKTNIENFKKCFNDNEDDERFKSCNYTIDSFSRARALHDEDEEGNLTLRQHTYPDNSYVDLTGYRGFSIVKKAVGNGRYLYNIINDDRKFLSPIPMNFCKNFMRPKVDKTDFSSPEEAEEAKSLYSIFGYTVGGKVMEFKITPVDYGKYKLHYHAGPRWVSCTISDFQTVVGQISQAKEKMKQRKGMVSEMVKNILMGRKMIQDIVKNSLNETQAKGLEPADFTWAKGEGAILLNIIKALKAENECFETFGFSLFKGVDKSNHRKCVKNCIKIFRDKFAKNESWENERFLKENPFTKESSYIDKDAYDFIMSYVFPKNFLRPNKYAIDLARMNNAKREKKIGLEDDERQKIKSLTNKRSGLLEKIEETIDAENGNWQFLPPIFQRVLFKNPIINAGIYIGKKCLIVPLGKKKSIKNTSSNGVVSLETLSQTMSYERRTNLLKAVKMLHNNYEMKIIPYNKDLSKPEFCLVIGYTGENILDKNDGRINKTI